MYILDTNNLRIGDIILTAQDEMISRAVRKLTGGPFSHAMLYVADHSYIHSDADGVHSANTQRLLFAKEGHVAVFRLQGADSNVIQRACAYARTQIGKQYSVPEAVKSKFWRAGCKLDESNRQFCSRLVAQAYAYSGVQLVRNAEYCYPIDFATSPLLHAVPDTLRQATSSEIRFAESESPIERQAKATNFILQQIRKLAGADIQTFEQLLPFLIGHPQHDGAICEIVKASGYLDLWKEDLLRNPWRYDAAEFLKLPGSNDDRAQVAHRELPAAKQQLQQFNFMYGQYMSLWQQTKLQYFAVELQLYINLMDVTKKRIDAAQQIIAVRSSPPVLSEQKRKFD
jgi:hypothetical protein